MAMSPAEEGRQDRVTVVSDFRGGGETRSLLQRGKGKKVDGGWLRGKQEQ